MRLNVPLIFVANKPLRLEKLANLSLIMVPEGADVADDRIAELVQPGDFVVTADIPLADRVVVQKAFAINPRGKLYTEQNIKDRLAMRDLLNELRDNGIKTGGPAEFSKKDRQAFANQLDSFLVRQLKLENEEKRCFTLIVFDSQMFEIFRNSYITVFDDDNLVHDAPECLGKEIYRYINKDGTIVITDKPPPEEDINSDAKE